MTEVADMIAKLTSVLGEIGEVAVAVSGGVDSMTLAAVAHRTVEATMFHAVSPAVPTAATRRVEDHAARHGWRMRLLDAGEFADRRYRANPVDRCFHCKTSLYSAIAARTSAVIVSGTNLDDLGDYRPGLRAAGDHGVRHPYVEAGIGKADLRRIAAGLGLDDLKDLPAAPCLSSRVETGIRIEPDLLAVIDAAERYLARQVAAAALRCRVRKAGVVIEIDDAALAKVSEADRTRLGDAVAGMFRREGTEHPVTFAPYRTGSAFVGR